MKFTQIIAPLATLSMVFAHGDKPEDTKSKHIIFSPEGIANLINVATNTQGADSKKATASVMEFFKLNPEVLKSIMAESSKPEHNEAKNKAITLAMDLYTRGDKIDLYKTGLELIDYTYENPKFLNLAQKVGIRVIKDSPTFVDDLFAQVEKAVAADPSLVSRTKDYLIKFSHDSEESYKRGFELVLKSAMINPGFSSHLLVHILKVDRMGCKGAAEGTCDCKKSTEYGSESAIKPVQEEINAGQNEDLEPAKEVDGEGSVDVKPVEEVDNEKTPVVPGPVENEIQIDEPIVQKEKPLAYTRPAYNAKYNNN